MSVHTSSDGDLGDDVDGPRGAATADGTDGAPLGPGGIEVRRSRRRRRTVSAYREGDRTIVLMPARFTRAEEEAWVQTMVDRLAAQDRRRRPSDAVLARRAKELSVRYLAGRAVPTSVAWVTNQSTRWGSCTPSDGTIRISSRVRGMPGWVLDYVLLHELAHLLQPSHGDPFWALLDAYPRTERARGYLEGVAATAGLELDDGSPLEEDVVPEPLEQSAKARRRSTQSRTRPPADG
ncbi:M48 metallopeptidase family protein [Angustibacter aerolatus]